ncbi:MAG TPA: VanZ family protein [Candidatus Hydrogenedens sp.]|nr:VanZ family protein [Candidatus Hydrogenedens sp.]
MRKRYLLLSIIYSVFIFWISIQPITMETPELFPYQDKIIHTFLYMLLAGIIAIGLVRADERHTLIKIGCISVMVPFIYGIFIEICQIFVPTRSFELLDIFANLCGAVIGTMVILLLSLLFNKWILRQRAFSKIKM